MNFVDWCDRVIRSGYYLLFALVPVLLTPWNYELFEFNKMMAVYALTVIITGAWMVKSIAQKELHIAKTPLDIPIALFFASQLVSAIFSIDPHVSWFGYYSRFNGGLLSIISYVLLYYAYVSNWSDEFHGSHVTKLLKVALMTGTVVALYGIAERLGIDKHLWVQDVQNRVFSTLGQPNWLAAYLVALIPLAAGFALKAQMSNFKVQNNVKTQNPKRFGNLDFGFGLSFGFLVWSSIAALFFLVLLFTRSRSGFLGFAVADAVFWGLLFWSSWRPVQNQSLALKSVRIPFFLLHLFFLLIIFFNGTSVASVDRWLTLQAWKERLSSTIQPSSHPTIAEATPSAYTAPLLESGGTESGTIRKYVWQGAIDAWQSSLKTYLVGTGTETFAFAFYQYRPKAHNLTSEWDFLYNKAHNEYLNYLATTGVFGLGSYVLFIGVFIVWFTKYQISRRRQSGYGASATNVKYQIDVKAQSSSTPTLELALFSGWLSILVTNFFGFSVVVVQLILFLFPAFAFVLVQQHPNTTIQHTRFPIRFPRWARWVILLVGAAVLVRLTFLWHADTLFASGYRASRAGEYAKAVEALERAAAVSPNEPLYQDELGTAYAGVVTAAIDARDATTAAKLVQKSLSASDRAIAVSPRNVNFWKTRTKIYYSFSSFDPAFNDAAVVALEKALELSPGDPKILYNLAILHGRTGTNDKAIDFLRQTIAMKPNYRDAYYALWVFYTEVKRQDLARSVLQEYLANVDPGDKDFLERLNE
ncbi:O-antigen ligase family protein [Candidatus Gottesmanbacteria bacterium]|nr:O-antigen ligase family protein [Candidatus Gottesmanbacteria bacterium]